MKTLILAPFLIFPVLFSSPSFATPIAPAAAGLSNEVDRYLKATTDRPPMTLNISTNFSKVIDREEIWTPSHDFSEGIGYLVDTFILGKQRDEQGVGERLARFSAALLAITPFEASAAIAVHEYGHFREFSKVGMYDRVFFDAENAKWIHGGLLGTLEVAMSRVFTLGNFPPYGATVSVSDRERILADSRLSPYQNYIYAAQEAGGFNQQQYQIEKIAEKVSDGHGNVFNLAPYSIHLVSHFFYPQLETDSDVSDYVNWLGTFGVQTSREEVQYYTQIPKLFSNSFLSLWRGVIGYVGYGEEKIEPITWDVGRFRVYWPEFIGHLTVRGPTAGVEQRNDFNGHAFFWGLERSIATGDTELSLGWRGAVSKILAGEARIAYQPGSGGAYFEAGPSFTFRIKKSYTVSFGALFYYGYGYTFRRDFVGQSFDFASDDEYGVKGFIKISFRF